VTVDRMLQVTHSPNKTSRQVRSVRSVGDTLATNVCCRMLTYSHVRSRTLTYAGVCWRMLTGEERGIWEILCGLLPRSCRELLAEGLYGVIDEAVPVVGSAWQAQCSRIRDLRPLPHYCYSRVMRRRCLPACMLHVCCMRCLLHLDRR
jgi:hypothetical protein